MVIQFNGLYGIDIADINKWLKLCVDLCIESSSDIIHQCQEVRS
jgi:hypothetical protein